MLIFTKGYLLVADDMQFLDQWSLHENRSNEKDQSKQKFFA